ncbi:MAG: OsmC family protein [Chloroflexi bacterium]|nr:OsmC family protein [Chloroflexota bacterium]
MASSGETVLHLEDNLRFAATTASGFKIDIDSPAGGGALAGPSPMELQLVALGGCTAMDTISILRKMRQDVTRYDVKLTNTRAEEHPKRYVAIELTHVVHGRGLSEANVRRAIELTMTRYCPVFAMLHPTVAITERYELVDEATGATTIGEVPLPDEAAAESAH